jgi:hypothetical protein
MCCHHTTITTNSELQVTIAAILHQPSWQLMSLFDNVLLLCKGGRVAYCGRVTGGAVILSCLLRFFFFSPYFFFPTSCWREGGGLVNAETRVVLCYVSFSFLYSSCSFLSFLPTTWILLLWQSVG